MNICFCSFVPEDTIPIGPCDLTKHRGDLFKDCVVMIINAADAQYEFVLMNCGAEVHPLYDKDPSQFLSIINTLGCAAIQSGRKACFFHDETRGSSPKVQLYKSFNAFM